MSVNDIGPGRSRTAPARPALDRERSRPHGSDRRDPTDA
jgi:hypothetical protein